MERRPKVSQVDLKSSATCEGIEGQLERGCREDILQGDKESKDMALIMQLLVRGKGQKEIKHWIHTHSLSYFGIAVNFVLNPHSTERRRAQQS